ncbi:unnamed protein product, partial [Tuber aestivum]
SLDQAASNLTDSIHQSLSLHVPLSKPCSRSKRWWNEEPTSMRSEMAKCCRTWKQSRLGTDYTDYKRSRNKYFRKIRDCKANCWQSFLNTARGQDIFTAVKYTRPTRSLKTPPLSVNQQFATDFDSKCMMFREAMFPDPPASKTTLSHEDTEIDKCFPWYDVTETDIKDAIFKSAPHKAPGPDGINFLCLRQVYHAIPIPLVKLFQAVLKTGYHPQWWREATGAIIRKPNKADYTTPKACRPVSLLNYLEMISEKIMAKRLAYIAETKGLLHSEQMAGRKERNSFLSKRQLGLAFDGQRQPLLPGNTGIPQGSPISPILFLFY